MLEPAAVEFLNAVAATDTNALYHEGMGTLGWITRSGSPGSYTYATIADRENKPVGLVSWHNALRFANWLDNGQPSGAQDGTTTEDGAYTFTGTTSVGPRNAGATIFLASEDEWFKAAYYDPALNGYFRFPTRTNDVPTLANDRLEELPDGRLTVRLKTRWRDGTTHVVMERSELIDRLVPLIPPPRAIRFDITASWRRARASGVGSCRPVSRSSVRTLLPPKARRPGSSATPALQ